MSPDVVSSVLLGLSVGPLRYPDRKYLLGTVEGQPIPAPHPKTASSVNSTKNKLYGKGRTKSVGVVQYTKSVGVV